MEVTREVVDNHRILEKRMSFHGRGWGPLPGNLVQGLEGLGEGIQRMQNSAVTHHKPWAPEVVLEAGNQSGENTYGTEVENRISSEGKTRCPMGGHWNRDSH